MEEEDEWEGLLGPLEAAEDGEFEDLLCHGSRSDLKWSMKDYRPPRYRYLRYRLPSDIVREVLQSNRVKHVILQLARETGQDTDSLAKQASDVLEEMGHQFSLFILRVLGGLIRKVFRQLTNKIIIHTEGLHQMKELSSETPILIMPTHRSYLDFILVSWILYSFDIKVPVIAAGQDFMFMKGVGSLLRRCGAFFIRRSFGKDKLYWALFTEYVQSHIINGDAPVEFFIEGTRSRTGKALQPKFGLLTIALEPYFDARVGDVAICPLSLSYERTVEENLHVRELMGIPKPPESTTGLIKARAILDNNYGSIHVKAGPTLSVHDMAVGSVDRKVRALVPRAVIPSVQPHERAFVNSLAYRVLLEQQKNTMVFPCSVMAAVLLQFAYCKQWSVSKQELYSKMCWVRQLLHSLNANLLWNNDLTETTVRPPDDTDPEYREKMLAHCVAMLEPVCYIEEGSVVLHTNPPTSEHLTTAFRHCHTLISLGRRRNELMHAVIRVAMLSKVLCRPTLGTRLKKQFCFLRSVLQCDFVFMPGAEDTDYSMALDRLLKIGAICETDVANQHQDKSYKFINNEIRAFLVSLIDPFIVTYKNSWQFCISYMPRTKEHSETMQSLATRIQTYLSILYNGTIVYGECLNLDVIKNSIHSLDRLGYVSIVKGSVYCENPNLLSDVIRDIALIIYPLVSKL